MIATLACCLAFALAERGGQLVAKTDLPMPPNSFANLYMQEFKQRYIEAGGVDNITLAVRGVASVPPTTYALAQNYPNPFNPSTHVQFSVADERFVSLKVYDILGREVSTLVGERMHPGTYVVEWNAAQCSSGMYFVRLEAGSFSATRKVILMK